ncbi:MAG: hypothetical protein M1831_000727 [Alyxoria varia]|nr:MAG: hypothetical protein M1831_000727 [Alyxoria varia]
MAQAAGGFKVSFFTDNIQGTMVVLLMVIGVITVGTESNIDRRRIDQSGWLEPSLVGWHLVYILPVAIVTNNFFLSHFWMRTFGKSRSKALESDRRRLLNADKSAASKTDKDLWIGVSIASVAVACILTLVGVSGLIAGWSGVYEFGSEEGYLSLFLLLGQLPAWVVGIVLVLVVSLSTAAFDSLQSAMVSTGSNDIFRNKLNLWIIRACVVVIIFPVVVVALKSPDILQIYLISDLVSASLIPVLFVGLWERAYFWRGFEVVVGSLGGILTVFIFGTIYYGNAEQGSKLIILEGGLYTSDWGAFGAFVAAPVGGFLWAIGALVLRLFIQWTMARVKGRRFDALDKPVERSDSTPEFASEYAAGDGVPANGDVKPTSSEGKFF